MSVTGLAGMRNLAALRPQLLPPAEIFAGTAATFKVRLKNTKTFLPSFLILLKTPVGEQSTFPLIAAGKTAEAFLLLTFPERGWQGIGKITISSPFPVNFFIRSWSVAVTEQFLIFPALLKTAAGSSEHHKAGSNGTVARERGLDGELERIAEYSGSEPLRMIHWKLSARGENLLVKDFGRQTATPLLINPDTISGITVEERISGAAWLVRRWAKERPVGLQLGDKIIPPAMGKHHALQLLGELAVYGL